MRWKLPTLITILWVVALFVLGALLGEVIGGSEGALVGVIPGALAAVLAGFIPVIREDSRRWDEDLASLEAEAAEAQDAWDAVGEPAVDVSSLGPAYLLRPHAQIVEFAGRGGELEALRSWRVSAATRSVRTIVAAGGVGKTRLALQVAAESEAEGWEWRLVGPGKEAGAVEAARGVTSGPVLLLIDYAETRTDLEVLLTSVLADPGRIRVLLMARSLGEWWDRLIEKSASAVGRLLTEAAPLPLAEPITTRALDVELVRTAMPYFAKALRVAVPVNVDFELPDHRVPVLVLHAAALVAVLRFSSEPARDLHLVVSDGILDELLEHEARYWRRSAGAAGLPDEGAVLKPLVAAAALLGAGSATEAADLVTLVPDLDGSTTADRRRWGRWLYELYPADDGGRLGSLQPDLLAETLVVRELAASDELARACMSSLAEPQAERALTILARAQVHQRQARELIAGALSADLTNLAIPAAKVALQTSSDLAPLLEAALRVAPVPSQTLMLITAALPYPSVTLAHARLAAAQRVLRSMPSDAGQATIAEWKNRVGTMLAELDRPSEALTPVLDAVNIYRRLSEMDPASFRPLLAMSLNNLGSTLYRLDRPNQALPAAQEAVAIRQELASAQPNIYLHELAQSLSNLGTALAGLGRFGDALIPARKALEVSRQLVATEPGDAHQHLLLQSLNNLSIWCSELGDIAEGLTFASEAAGISRALAEMNPDRHAPDLAHCLSNLAMQLARAARTAEALEASQESIAIYRGLIARNNSAYQVDMAASLMSLGSRFTELGDLSQATETTEQALTIYRELADTNNGAYRAEIALCLSNLGAQRAYTGHAAEGLKHTEQAVTIYRELATANPDKYNANLAQSLYNLSQRLRNTGRLAEAIPPLEEAVTLRRRLTQTRKSAVYEAALAHSLNNLSALRAELGDISAAHASIQEAIRIYRTLADEDQRGYRGYLGKGLMLLSDILSALGRDADANVARIEATDILSNL